MVQPENRVGSDVCDVCWLAAAAHGYVATLIGCWLHGAQYSRLQSCCASLVTQSNSGKSCDPLFLFLLALLGVLMKKLIFSKLLDIDKVRYGAVRYRRDYCTPKIRGIQIQK